MIEELNLSGNELDDDKINCIKKYIKEMKLKTLNLSGILIISHRK